MSSHERRRSRRTHGSSHAPPRSALRVIALAVAGLSLMGAAYQGAFAGTGGPAPDYTPARGDDDGLSGGEIALIGGGAAAGGLGIAAAAGAFGTGAAAGGLFPIGGPHDCKERYDQLPQGETDLSSIRLVPQSSKLDAGFCRCFHLEVKSRRDGKWYSVTHRPESRIEEIDGTRTPLTRMDGAKNIFCLPVSAPQSFNGQSTQIEGVFQLPNAVPMRASARVVMHVPDEAGLFRTAPEAAAPIP